MRVILDKVVSEGLRITCEPNITTHHHLDLGLVILGEGEIMGMLEGGPSSLNIAHDSHHIQSIWSEGIEVH